MTLQEAGLTYRQIDDMLVAGIVFNGPTRDYDTIYKRLRQVHDACGEYRCGPARLVYHFETAGDGKMDLEVCMPVTQPIETESIKSRMLAGGEALSMRHPGPIETVNDTSQKIFAYMREHGLPPKEPCLVFPQFDAENPENTVIEVQGFVHPWTRLLNDNLQHVMGAQAAATVMQGHDAVTVESSMDERCAWIKGAMARLDKIADESQKHDILTPCAHVFPQTLIDWARAFYQRTHDLDALIDEMAHGHHSLPKVIERDGRVIYDTKRPADPETYESATTLAEKREAACFCPMIRHRLDAGISPSFCYCSAGWFRQIWEGILGYPVRVEILETVLKGDPFCRFAVYLPEELNMAATPPQRDENNR